MPVRCQACESTAVTRISITMAEGAVVDFTSCHRCEHRSYASAGQTLELDRVKELAARKK